jgi:hypothetical protein
MAEPIAAETFIPVATLTTSEAELWEQAMAGILCQPGQTTAAGSKVLPWLLIGGKHAATDASDTNTQQVTHVLNLSEPWSAEGRNRDSLRCVAMRMLRRQCGAVMLSCTRSVPDHHLHHNRQSWQAAVNMLSHQLRDHCIGGTSTLRLVVAGTN